MCKHMRGKVGAPVLRSKETEVAGGQRCNTRSCTGSQSGFFSVSPEGISQTTQAEVTPGTRVMPRWLVARRRALFHWLACSPLAFRAPRASCPAALLPVG